VVRVGNEDAARKRVRWLAELAAALDEARRLVKELGVEKGSMDASELSARIEAVRLEVQAMRLLRAAGGHQLDPNWTKDIPWKQSA
jgi:hypothetical protein